MLNPLRAVLNFFSLFDILTVKVNTDTGKVEIILTKEWEKQWPSVGKHLGKHNKTVKLKDQGKTRPVDFLTIYRVLLIHR